MSFAVEEALEADWVAVRPNVFEEKEKHKFVFIVAWNEIEGKFAITCHNRTAQRQRSTTRNGRSRTSEPGSPEPAAARSPAMGKAELRSPLRKTPAKSSSGSNRGGESVPGSPGIRMEATRGSPVRSKMNLDSPTRKVGEERDVAGGQLRALTPRAAIEEPEPLDVAPEEAELLDVDAQEECSWAGLFSFHDLRAVHQQLCSVNCELEPCLPAFPEEPSGMWTVLFGGAPEFSDQELDGLCCQLQFYLGHALDTCGWKILSQVLFTESDDPEEYYESLSELRQKGYEEVLQRARKRLQESGSQYTKIR